MVYSKRKLPKRLQNAKVGEQLYYCRYKQRKGAEEEGCGRVINVATLPGMKPEFAIGDPDHGYLCNACYDKRKEVCAESEDALRQRWKSSPFYSILYWRDRDASQPPLSYFKPCEGLSVLQRALALRPPKWDTASLRDFSTAQERIRHVAQQVRQAQVRIYSKYARYILQYLAPPKYFWGTSPTPDPPSKELRLWFLLHPGAPQLFPASTLWAMCRRLLVRTEVHTQVLPALHVDLVDVYDEYFLRETEAWKVEQHIIQHEISCTALRVRPEYACKSDAAARWGRMWGQTTLDSKAERLLQEFCRDVITGLGRDAHMAVIHLCEMLYRWSRVALRDVPAWEFREQILEEIGEIFDDVLCEWQAKADTARINAAIVTEHMMDATTFYLDPRGQGVQQKIYKQVATWPICIRRASHTEHTLWRKSLFDTLQTRAADAVLKKSLHATDDYPPFTITRRQMFGAKEGGWKNTPADKRQVALLRELKGYPPEDYRLDIEFAQKLTTRTPVVYELRQPHIDADEWGPVKLAFFGNRGDPAIPESCRSPLMTTLYLRHAFLKPPTQRYALLTLIAQHPLISGRSRLALAHWLEDARLWRLMAPWILTAYLGSSYFARDVTLAPLIDYYPMAGPVEFAQLIRDRFPSAWNEASLTGGFWAAAITASSGSGEEMMRAISWMRTDAAFGNDGEILEFAGRACRWAALQLCHRVLDLGAALYPDRWGGDPCEPDFSPNFSVPVL